MPASQLVWAKCGTQSWLPLGIVTQGPQPAELGVSPSGRFVVCVGGNGVEIEKTGALTPLLVFLEVPRGQFEEQLLRAPEELRQFAGAFPFSELLSYAFKSRSEYWAELAMRWAEHPPHDGVPRDELLAVSEARWASQRLRHRARALARRL